MNKETIKRNRETKITVYDALCGTGKSCAAITNIKDSTDRVVIITVVLANPVLRLQTSRTVLTGSL